MLPSFYNPSAWLPGEWRCAITVALVVWLGCSSVACSQSDPDPFARWDADIAAFARQDEVDPPQPHGIVFVGSSSIRRWDLAASFPELRAVNRGFGGSEIADTTHFVERLLVVHQPRIVVLYAGDNDLNAGKSPQQVTQDFRDLVEVVHEKLPTTDLVFLSIKPCRSRWHLVESVRQANQAIEAVCQADERLWFVDLFTPMLNAQQEPRDELFVADRLHLSAEGYVLWTEKVQAVIQQIDTKRSAP